MVKRAIQEASEAAESAVEQGKVLCPWLPDPKRCEACGAYCDATEEYVDTQAMVVPIWKCPTEGCAKSYYRDRD